MCLWLAFEQSIQRILVILGAPGHWVYSITSTGILLCDPMRFPPKTTDKGRDKSPVAVSHSKEQTAGSWSTERYCSRGECLLWVSERQQRFCSQALVSFPLSGSTNISAPSLSNSAYQLLGNRNSAPDSVSNHLTSCLPQCSASVIVLIRFANYTKAQSS